MKRIFALLLVAALAACAHLTAGSPGARDAASRWAEAHRALAAGDYEEARNTFRSLAAEYPNEPEGREAVFFLGALHLDPRNPGWDPVPAAERLRNYLASDADGEQISRRPEAVTLLQIAEQLAIPPEQRVRDLAPETPAAAPPAAPQRVTPTRDLLILSAEADSLRRQLVERDEQIRRQREELERIRRTLMPVRPPESATPRGRARDSQPARDTGRADSAAHRNQPHFIRH